MMTRRAAVGGSLALAAALAAPVRATGGDAPFFARHGLPIGIQLFPLVSELKRDLAGTLRRIAQIGYRAVETAGLLGYDAAAFRGALDKAGLACGGMNVLGRPLPGGGQSLSTHIDALIADARTMGANHLTMGLFLFPENFLPSEKLDSLSNIRAAARLLTAADYHRMAAFLNEKGAYLAARGLRLGYHNHNVEFAMLDGGTGFDILLGETDPALVHFELDAGWAAVAGVDIARLFAAHPGRFTQMHVKDITLSASRNFEMRQDPAFLGQGVIDWKRLLPLAYRAGVRNFYVEQEAPFIGDRLDAMAANYSYLAELRTTG